MATKKEYGVYHVSNQQGNDPDAIKFTEQDLTSEEQAQARDNIGAAPDDIPAVKYVAQTLTDAQKAQARTNISAPSVADLNAIGNGSYVEAWDGASTPVVADIPAGVVVTYNTTDYTGTLAASASTVGKIYLVSTGTAGNYDRYITEVSGSTYSWTQIGTTAIDLSDYATKEEVSQLSQEVNGVAGYNKDITFPITPGTSVQRNVKYPVALVSGVEYSVSFATSPTGITFGGMSFWFYGANSEQDYYTYTGVNQFNYTPSFDVVEVGVYIDGSAISAAGTYNLNIHKDGVPGLVERVADLEDLEDEVEDVQKELSAIDGTESVVRNGKVLSETAFALTVGSAPTSESNASYNAVRAYDLRENDVIHIKARSGSSYLTWAKLLNGTVTWVCGSYVSIDEDIVCDGTFDEIITNSYNSYVANPYITVTRTEGLTELTRTLKVLVIGNSFSEDSTGYIPGIVRKLFPTLRLTIGVAYMGGSPLAQHYAYFSGQDVTLDSFTYKTENGVYKRINNGIEEFSGLYTLYKSVNGAAWTTTSETVQQFLENEEWDVITFQQSGTQSPLSWETYYAPYIYKLQKLVFSKIAYATRLGWVLVHGAYGATHAANLTKWEGGATNAEKVMRETGCSILIPYGTAVQNLRSTTLASLGDGEAHDLLADTAHMQEGIGPLAAAYTYLLTFARAIGLPYGVIGDDTRPDSSFLSAYNVPGQNIGSGIIGITEANCLLAQIAAEKAVMNPYEVTDLSVFEE